MDKTYKTNVLFTRIQLQELSTVSAKTQLGRSELVRRAVDHYLIEIRKQGTIPSLNSLQTLTNDAATEEQ
ncbi:MAG: ribbon-helix-helix domain-containing protein [Caldilineaceae bacterium SB0665_bin_25]|nr:ribbon-helix-helix domain-containing protein [Caldilineaceae bacterium SB0665_bin_25]